MEGEFGNMLITAGAGDIDMLVEPIRKILKNRVKSKITIRKILFITVWLCIGAGMVTLLLASITKKIKDYVRVIA